MVIYRTDFPYCQVLSGAPSGSRLLHINVNTATLHTFDNRSDSVDFIELSFSSDTNKYFVISYR